MLKILKNLKKTIISVIIIILLLCVQAWTDLILPDYTSKIVNIGIQQNGIENTAPEVIEKSRLETLLLFTNKDEKILKNYNLISKDILEEKVFEKYIKEYPILENEELYIIKQINKEEQKELNNIMTKPLMMLYILTTQDNILDINQINKLNDINFTTITFIESKPYINEL